MTNVFLEKVIKELNRDQAEDKAQIERYDDLIYKLKTNMNGREEVLFLLGNRKNE